MMDHHVVMGEFKTLMQPVGWYDEIDAGIRFPLRVLHAAGIETCQCCEGGAGHSYDRPTIDLPSGTNATGFAALSALTDYGLNVWDVAKIWSVSKGEPTSRIWRITFRQHYILRAAEIPIFVHGYVSSPVVI